MASSETELPEQLFALFDRLLRHRDLSMFLPFVLGFTHGSTEGNPDEETPPRESERIILVNPFTQGMVVVEGGASSLETLFRELGISKGGHPPASRASIEAMKCVEVGEGEVKEGECCVVCLEDWEVGGLVKVMPCNHRFHSNCIDKWLGLHGSCPVCRYTMPVEEEEGKTRGEGEEEEEVEVEGEGEERRRRGLGREIWVSFSFNGARTSNVEQGQGQDQANDDDDASSSPATEMEG